MNKPFVRDNAIFIPTNDCGSVLTEYRDETVLVAGEILQDIWGYRYYGGNYRHRATDNPEADLAAVLAVCERNTAPKPKVPYLKGMNLYIPADEGGILPDYQDPSVKVVGMALDSDWGYPRINGEFRILSARNPKAALAAVLAVYERNTNKDVVITITKLPPSPHPESGTEIPVPVCRVALGVDMPDNEVWHGVARLISLKKVTVFEAEKMSEAVVKAEAEAAVVRTAACRYKKMTAAYNEKRAAAIAAADEEYERRANS